MLRNKKYETQQLLVEIGFLWVFLGQAHVVSRNYDLKYLQEVIKKKKLFKVQYIKMPSTANPKFNLKNDPDFLTT